MSSIKFSDLTILNEFPEKKLVGLIKAVLRYFFPLITNEITRHDLLEAIHSDESISNVILNTLGQLFAGAVVHHWSAEQLEEILSSRTALNKETRQAICRGWQQGRSNAFEFAQTSTRWSPTINQTKWRVDIPIASNQTLDKSEGPSDDTKTLEHVGQSRAIVSFETSQFQDGIQQPSEGLKVEINRETLGTILSQFQEIESVFQKGGL